MTDKTKKKPHSFREVEHQWIEMPDGIRLAARLWLPKATGPVPAILEYIPYRKRDMVRARDERNHPYFASHGYASLRVDMRGSGDSEGHMPDMYATDELQDARHVIEWIAQQSWCDGRVGMFGTSWGGTASLQAAVKAPGPLKAVLANCATIDRFEDDIHWMGGCLLTDSIEWGATLPAILAAPPDAATVGPGWMDQWKARLESLAFPFATWARNATRGTYWRHGSMRFQTDDLTCPLLAIGGWSDRYSNTVMPLVKARPDLCWGIVGPWGHHYPDQAEPGPAINFQQVALSWWDHWLKERPNAVADWPRLRLWRREFDAPQDRLRQRQGGWIEFSTDQASSGDQPIHLLHLHDQRLCATAPQTSQVKRIPNDLRHGECAGDTGYFGRVGGLPLDQSTEDARGLWFDTDPLGQPLDILGHIALTGNFATSGQGAPLVCRMCDVDPDGQSNLICRTIQNLSLDTSLEPIGPQDPGFDPSIDPSAGLGEDPTQWRHVSLTLPSTAYRVAAGHRLRLVLGTSYWPLVMPCATAADVQMATDSAQLAIPLAPSKNVAVQQPFPLAEPLPLKPSWTRLDNGPLERGQAKMDGGCVNSGWHQPAATTTFPDQSLAISTGTDARYCIDPDDPASAQCTMRHQIVISRADGVARIDSSLNVANGLDGLRITSDLLASWNETQMIHRSETEFVPAPGHDPPTT